MNPRLPIEESWELVLPGSPPANWVPIEAGPPPAGIRCQVRILIRAHLREPPFPAYWQGGFWYKANSGKLLHHGYKVAHWRCWRPA